MKVTIKPIKKHVGFSLMVLAILNLQGNLAYNAASTIQDAKHDGQVSTALLTAQKLVMNAGYGIEGAGNTDIVIVETVATATTAFSTSLLWRYKLNGNVICNGIRDTAKTENGVDFRALIIIEPASGSSCDESTPLDTINWSVETGVIGKWRIDAALTNHLTNNDSLFEFQIRSSTCSPYGSEKPVSRVIALISAPSSTQLGGLAGAPNAEIEFCLQNTRV